MNELANLTASPLLQDLQPEDLEILETVFHSKNMAEGTTVFVENMPGESLYLILSGTIKISKMITEGEERILAVLGPEDCFGELAVLDGTLRSTTARVAEDAVLLKMGRGDFEELCDKNPAFGLKLTRNIVRGFCRRLRENDAEYKQILQHLAEISDRPEST